MPLLFLAWLTYAAGLFMGFGGVAFPGVALGVVALGWGVLQRDARTVALALLLSAGALRAHGERATDAGCMERTLLDGRASVLLSTDMFTLVDEDAIVPIDDFAKTEPDPTAW